MARHLRHADIMTSARIHSCIEINGLSACGDILTGQDLRLAGQGLPGARAELSQAERF
jgi:hypothetical protein